MTNDEGHSDFSRGNTHTKPCREGKECPNYRNGKCNLRHICKFGPRCTQRKCRFAHEDNKTTTKTSGEEKENNEKGTNGVNKIEPSKDGKRCEKFHSNSCRYQHDSNLGIEGSKGPEEYNLNHQIKDTNGGQDSKNSGVGMHVELQRSVHSLNKEMKKMSREIREIRRNQREERR